MDKIHQLKDRDRKNGLKNITPKMQKKVLCHMQQYGQVESKMKVKNGKNMWCKY